LLSRPSGRFRFNELTFAKGARRGLLRAESRHSLDVHRSAEIDPKETFGKASAFDDPPPAPARGGGISRSHKPSCAEWEPRWRGDPGTWRLSVRHGAAAVGEGENVALRVGESVASARP
jgi:hypothetical protein